MRAYKQYKETRDMSFLALASQKSALMLQKNFLQFNLIKIQNEAQYAVSCMNDVKKQIQSMGSDAEYEDDPMYIYYEQLDEQLESEKDSIESQITLLDNEISGLKTMVNSNIKSSCTLNIASGG